MDTSAMTAEEKIEYMRAKVAAKRAAINADQIARHGNEVRIIKIIDAFGGKSIVLQVCGCEENEIVVNPSPLHDRLTFKTLDAADTWAVANGYIVVGTVTI